MFNRYRKNTEGNVAIMFAVSVTSLLIAIGAAVDYAGLSSQRQDLQDMVDAATLAAARENTTNEKKLARVAKKFMKEHKTKGQKINLVVKVVDDEVFVTATTSYETYLMGMVGKKSLDVVAEAASPIAALTPVKVALVLDTTTSMEGSNIAALKMAATSMITEFESFEAPVAVSVVPFGQYVNIGTENKKQNWLDVDQDGKSETKEVCWNERKTTKARQCTKTGNTLYRDDIRDGRNFGQVSYEEQSCTPAEYEYTGNRICEDRTTKYEWDGCVGSRTSPYNEQAEFGRERIPGVMNKSCGTPVQTLTLNMNKVKSTISSLTPEGSTYLPSGAIWGWRSLQAAEPFNTTVKMTRGNNKTSADPVKAMVIMTDGDNTLSHGGSEDHLHNGSDKAAANARTLALCTAAKADGIQIYTVGYRMDDATTQKLLQDCATSPTNYSPASNAAQLKAVFQNIAGQLDFSRLSM